MLHKIIAVSSSSFDQWGCIQCGSDSVYNSRGVSGVATVPAKCKECDTEFVLLSHGLTKSNLGFGHPAVYPKLHKHPRKGIKKHAYIRPDIRPEGGGEYFAPRGLNCGLAGFVKCKEAGERIVKMFSEIALERNNPNDTLCFICGKNPAKLDYRKEAPDWIRVVIGYCPEGRKNIEILHELTSNGIITKEKIIQAIDGIEPEKVEPNETDENTEVGSFVLTSVITVKMNR